MAADHFNPGDVDQTIAQTLRGLYDTVLEQASAEEDDSRRAWILNMLGTLLEQPLRAARLLTEEEAAREHAH